MKVHVLKLQQPFFDDVYFNRKEFEVRKKDRNFEVGDRIKFLEFPYDALQKFVIKDVKYILEGGQYGIEKGYVVLGLKEMESKYDIPNSRGSFWDEIAKETVEIAHKKGYM
ncbi:DUF3850 domain-containing protein [Flavobacterium facile]|uniref:DUF3850 domain-containing protein n=1 Tax=Flavobacterium facile TaxID=2893174 RepID=UPI002E79A56E|nr:DUF3850 domain-containing protein [Flavobacterium sp. T-12]